MNNESGLFGVPIILEEGEATTLARALTALWTHTYGQPPAGLEEDLQLCRRFFDPIARGSRLRELLATVTPAPAVPPSVRGWLVDPLTVAVDAERVLVGPEARVILHLLAGRTTNGISWSDREVADAYKTLATTYRLWSRQRLEQVIALRSGHGREAMQAIAVGVVIALLVNRSTTPERALHVTDSVGAGGSVDAAVFAAADAFARRISGRNERSTEQHRLKGGYGVSEARRRLGELLPGDSSNVYIAPGASDEVVAILARELARRTRVTTAALEQGLDDLISTYRERFAAMALRIPSHERTADTASLRGQLIAAFELARGRGR